MSVSCPASLVSTAGTVAGASLPPRDTGRDRPSGCTLFPEWLALEVWHLTLPQVGWWTALWERPRGHLTPWWQRLSPETYQTRPGPLMWLEAGSHKQPGPRECSQSAPPPFGNALLFRPKKCSLSNDLFSCRSAYSEPIKRHKQSRWHSTLEPSFLCKTNIILGPRCVHTSCTQELVLPPPCPPPSNWF